MSRSMEMIREQWLLGFLKLGDWRKQSLYLERYEYIKNIGIRDVLD